MRNRAFYLSRVTQTVILTTKRYQSYALGVVACGKAYQENKRLVFRNCSTGNLFVRNRRSFFVDYWELFTFPPNMGEEY